MIKAFKFPKKLCLSLLLAFILIIPTVFSSCDWQFTPTSDPILDNSKIKIGVSIWSSTDVLGSKCKKVLDQCANALGIKIQYIDQGHKSEEVVASVEKLCAAGCQGIIICNSSDSEMISAIKTCNDTGVYIAQFFRRISKDLNPDIYNMACEEPCYAGCVYEDEEKNGEKLIEILCEKGDRNIGVIGWEQGDATWLGRYEGYKKGIEIWNASHPNDKAKLSEPQYAGTTSDGGSKAAEALMSADSSITALIAAGGGGDPLLGTIAAVERANKVGKIHVVSTDFLADLGQRLSDGSMTAESGGHFWDPMFALMLVYNTLRGNYSVPVHEFREIEFPYIYVSSPQDYELFEKYFVEDTAFTDEEIIQISNLTLEQLQQKSLSINIDDAINRHAKK